MECVYVGLVDAFQSIEKKGKKGRTKESPWRTGQTEIGTTVS